MDKLDFAARLAAYKRDSNRQAIPALIVLCAALIGTMFLVPYVVTSNWLTLLFCVTLLGILIGWTIYIERNTKRIHQKHHLHCPYCDHTWVSEVSRQIVMATGHCGHCGSRVLTGE